MATGVTVYKSTDGSAPTLSGTAGDLVNLLDKCLVTGYGAKPAAGWTKPYTGTNAAAFQMGGGNQFFLDVDDNGPGAGGAREARMRGYETMSAVATGTGLFPTVAQLAAGIICRKSTTADATTRTWIVVADDRTVYLFFNAGDGLGYTGFLFGDFYSTQVGDNYRTMIIGRVVENSGTGANEHADRIPANVYAATMTGHYLAREYTGLGTAVQCAKVTDSLASAATYLGGATLKFPNPSTGGFVASHLYLQTGALAGANVNWRGTLRGFYQTLVGAFPTNFADGDTLDSITGRSFLIIGRTYQNAAASFLVETSDTWDTNI